jgi:X-Pro dipeptidyl-peptidase
VRSPAWPLIVTLLFLGTGCLQTSRQHETAPTAPLTDAAINASLTQPTFHGLTYSEDLVGLRDSTKIWVDVYRPSDDPQRVPVILTMTPYHILSDTEEIQCSDPSREKCPYLPDMVDFYVPRGYAVAFADAPGNHDSGGCSDYAGPETGQAGYNVVEWLANQSWSNGRVGMYGASYDGETQLATVILNPPHLATIVPSAAPTSGYDYLYYHGVPYLLHDQSMPEYTAISAAPGQNPNAIQTYPQRLECQPANLAEGSDSTGDWNAYWQARDARAVAPRIRASVLETQGFLDGNVKPDSVAGFWNDLTSPKMLIAGQWDHGQPTMKDWQFIVHRWFDHYLKGIDTGLASELPEALVQDTTGNWTRTAQYPPVDPTTLALYPSADGALVATRPSPSQGDIQDYPRAGFGGYALALDGASAALDQAGAPSQLVFTSAPLAADLHIFGQPIVHLKAATNEASTHWAARLYDADRPSQTAYNQEGLELNKGLADTRHRFGVNDPEDVTPGQRYSVNITFYPHDDFVPKGHRLRLVLDNNDPLMQQDTTYARSTVFLGGPNGTWMELPIAPAK